MKQKIAWIDIAKAMAIFAIVLGHVLRGGTVQAYLLSFHVPLFFMLSGCVFSAQKFKNFGEFLKRKFYTILLPYLLWGLISIIIFSLFGDMAGDSLGVDTSRDSNIWVSILGLIYGNTSVLSLKSNLPLWFLPCLFILQIGFYAIDRYLNKNAKTMVLVTLGLFVVAGVNQLIFHVWKLPFNAENALFMSGYFGIGMCMRYVKQYAGSEKISWTELVSGAVLVAIGAFVATRNSHIAYSWSIYGRYSYFMISSICGCFGFILLARQLKHAPVLEFVGQSTLAILVMHKFPIVFFQVIVPYVKDYLAVNNTFVAICVAVIVIGMCLAMQYVLVKFTPFLLGKCKNN